MMNIGDATEIQSNGMYQSIEHRATTNEEKPRISIATFMFLADEQEISPVETILNDHHHRRIYRNIKYVEYIRKKIAKRMEGKAHIDLLKLKRK
ncbi:hypothetical protein PTKIN_Ptkin09bG0200200 [Pterospermum kingtungense]